MRRPCVREVAEVCKDARRVVVIHGVVDTTNIGAIFRSAAALGYRCRTVDHGFVRSAEPSGGTRVDGGRCFWCPGRG